MRSWWIIAASVVAIALGYKLFGRPRIARFDGWLRRTLRDVAKLTLAVARVFAVLLLLLACLFGIVAVAFLLDMALAVLVGNSAVTGCVAVLLVVPLSLYLAYHSLKLQAALTLRFAASYVQTWREVRGTTPPWPFSWFDTPSPRERDAFLLSSLLLPLVALHVLALAMLLAVGALLLPLHVLRSLAEPPPT